LVLKEVIMLLNIVWFFRRKLMWSCSIYMSIISTFLLIYCTWCTSRWYSCIGWPVLSCAPCFISWLVFLTNNIHFVNTANSSHYRSQVNTWWTQPQLYVCHYWYHMSSIYHTFYICIHLSVPPALCYLSWVVFHCLLIGVIVRLLAIIYDSWLAYLELSNTCWVYQNNVVVTKVPHEIPKHLLSFSDCASGHDISLNCK